jgi:hypothetical protein
VKTNAVAFVNERGKLLGDRVEALDREGLVVAVVADEDFLRQALD